MPLDRSQLGLPFSMTESWTPPPPTGRQHPEQQMPQQQQPPGSNGTSGLLDSLGIAMHGSPGPGGASSRHQLDVNIRLRGGADSLLGVTPQQPQGGGPGAGDDGGGAVTGAESQVVQDLEILDIIGRGGFGSVYRGEWRGRPVAVKVR